MYIDAIQIRVQKLKSHFCESNQGASSNSLGSATWVIWWQTESQIHPSCLGAYGTGFHVCSSSNTSRRQVTGDRSHDRITQLLMHALPKHDINYTLLDMKYTRDTMYAI